MPYHPSLIPGDEPSSGSIQHGLDQAQKRRGDIPLFVFIRKDADRLGVEADVTTLNVNIIPVMEAEPVTDMVLGHVEKAAGFLEPWQPVVHLMEQGVHFRFGQAWQSLEDRAGSRDGAPVPFPVGMISWDMWKASAGTRVRIPRN